MKSLYNYLIYFLLLIPPLIFFTDLTRNPYYFQIVLVNSVTVIFWGIWLFAGLKKNKLVLKRTPFDFQLIAFFIAATISLVLMLLENLQHPYLAYAVDSEGLKRWLFLLVNSMLVYYIPVYFGDDTNRQGQLTVVFLAGFIASIYGILQYFGIELIWPKVLNPFGSRCVSTFGNPNFLSSYLVLLIPLSYSCFIANIDTKKNITYIAITFSFFAALLSTLTRSSLLGLFAAMVFNIGFVVKYERTLFAQNWKKIFLVPFGFMFFLALFWPKGSAGGYTPSLVGRLMEYLDISAFHVNPAKIFAYSASFIAVLVFALLFWFVFKKKRKLILISVVSFMLIASCFVLIKGARKGYSALDQRKLIWSCAWHMVCERPVFGKGWGCFELFYPYYQGRHLFLDVYRNLRTHANNTHNEILEIWSQTGTIGFGIYLWLIVSIIVYGLFLIKNSYGYKRFLAIGLFSSLIGMWVDNLLNVSMHFAIPGFLYWWNLGLLANLGRNEDKTIELKSFRTKIAVLFILVLSGMLAVRYARNFLGEIHYFKGFKLSKNNDVRGAISELERAHAYQRLEVNNNYELANCYARSGLRDKAIWAYKESLRANSGYDEIYFNMATVLSQKGEIEQAIDEYTRSIYINPVSFETYMALGSIFLQNPEKYAVYGRSLFKQCIYFYPNNKDLWNNLGFLYTRSGQNDEALPAYKKALEIAPDFELANKNLRYTLLKLGRTDETFEQTQKLFRIVEESISAKNWAKALANCERLVKLVPKSFNARLYLANIYFTVGRVGDAIGEYIKAQEIDPNNPSLAANLGLAYFETKQLELAKNQFQKLLQVDPKNELAKQKIDEINKISAK